MKLRSSKYVVTKFRYNVLGKVISLDLPSLGDRFIGNAE